MDKKPTLTSEAEVQGFLDKLYDFCLKKTLFPLSIFLFFFFACVIFGKTLPLWDN